MNAVQQFRDRPNPSGTFDQLFRAALETFLPDLASAPWHVREREVVNLFVFHGLIPQFRKHKLDITQISIEVPVLKLRENAEATPGKPKEVGIIRPDMERSVSKPAKEPRQTLGKYGDIVVWPHARATIWQTCRPLAHIEWKNISCREENPGNLERGHKKDVRHLEHNRNLVDVSYAVLTDQRDKHVKVRCMRIMNGKESEDFFAAEALGRAVTCPPRTITNLQHSYSELLSRPQGSACPDCTPRPSGRRR